MLRPSSHHMTFPSHSTSLKGHVPEGFPDRLCPVTVLFLRAVLLRPSPYLNARMLSCGQALLPSRGNQSFLWVER